MPVVSSDTGLEICAVNLGGIDLQSLRSLEAIYRLCLEKAPNLYLFYDVTANTRIASNSWDLDEHGMLRRVADTYVLDTVFGFQCLIEEPAIDCRSEFMPHTIVQVPAVGDLPLRDGDRELRAYNILESRGQPISTAECVFIVEVLRGMFRNYSFIAAINLGKIIVECSLPLSQEQVAEVHGILALSAHNHQFRTRNESFINFLEKHLSVALEHETRACVLSALYYRLAVTLGRRKKQFHEALESADKAIEAAADPRNQHHQKIYLGAWAHNIRAYILMNLKKVEEARFEAQRCHSMIGSLLKRSASDEAGHRKDEIQLTQVVLTDNLATLAYYSGSLAKAESLRQSRGHLVKALTNADLDHIDGYGWIDLYLDTYRMRDAFERALKCLEGARVSLHGFDYYRYLALTGFFAYRLGDAGVALKYFKEARSIRDLSINKDILLPMECNCAFAYFRSGSHGKAISLLDRALRLKVFQPIEARAEIIAVKSLVAAHRCDADRAEYLINQSIDLAVESGCRDSLLKTANFAGQVAQVLNRPAEAEDAYQRALEISAHEETEKGPPAADLFRTLLGLQECGYPDDEIVIRSLELLPDALKETEAWWDLGRLLPILEMSVDKINGFDPEKVNEPLRICAIAADQRSDCDLAFRQVLRELIV